MLGETWNTWFYPCIGVSRKKVFNFMQFFVNSWRKNYSWDRNSWECLMTAKTRLARVYLVWIIDTEMNISFFFQGMIDQHRLYGTGRLCVCARVCLCVCLCVCVCVCMYVCVYLPCLDHWYTKRRFSQRCFFLCEVLWGHKYMRVRVGPWDYPGND